jgi:hypothetical protein
MRNYVINDNVTRSNISSSIRRREIVNRRNASSGELIRRKPIRDSQDAIAFHKCVLSSSNDYSPKARSSTRSGVLPTQDIGIADMIVQDLGMFHSRVDVCSDAAVCDRVIVHVRAISLHV